MTDLEGLASRVEALDGAHDALNRMRRACERGTGCYLTSEMVKSLEVSVIGAFWAQDDPRAQKGD